MAPVLGPLANGVAAVLQERCKCEPFSFILASMDVAAAPAGLALDPGYVSLSALSQGSSGLIVGVGTATTGSMTSLERRLLELGFISGEQFEVVAEAWPGRDPFVVRVGNTTLALRRREAESVWVELSRSNPHG
jgi:ferrous iron transport protein A